MIYIVTYAVPQYKQLSIFDYINILEEDTHTNYVITNNKTNTRTCVAETYSRRLLKFNTYGAIRTLYDFTRRYDGLINLPKNEAFRTYYKLKQNGKRRRIDEPIAEVKVAIDELKNMIQTLFSGRILDGEDATFAMYHTSAAAYIKGRGTQDARERHMRNGSWWYGRVDLHNFFGSVTLDFTMSMLSKIYPFSLVCSNERGYELLRKALSIAFIDNTLPQGTTISPMLTNIIMIPIDFEITKRVRDFDKQSFVYTRYADDFIFSSKYQFDIRKLQHLMEEVFREFNAPLVINTEKNSYHSRNGSNWILGAMVNRDNNATVGYRRKKALSAALTNYILDRNCGRKAPLDEVQHLQGELSYCFSIEPERTNEILDKLSAKFETDIRSAMKADLRG